MLFKPIAYKFNLKPNHHASRALIHLYRNTRNVVTLGVMKIDWQWTLTVSILAMPIVPARCFGSDLSLGIAGSLQYSIVQGSNPQLSSTGSIFPGVGLFLNDQVNPRTGMQLGLVTTTRTANGPSSIDPIPNEVRNTSVQAQLLGFYSLTNTLRFGIGGHIDYLVHEPPRIIIIHLSPGYDNPATRDWNFGLTAAFDFMPALEWIGGRPFFDLRYQHSLKKIYDGLWAGQPIDLQIDQLQMYLGLSWPIF